MAGHSRWKTLRARRLAETGDIVEHPEYEQAGRAGQLPPAVHVPGPAMLMVWHGR